MQQSWCGLHIESTTSLGGQRHGRHAESRSNHSFHTHHTLMQRPAPTALSSSPICGTALPSLLWRQGCRPGRWGSPPYWSVVTAAKCVAEPRSVHWMKIVGLAMNDWSVPVDLNSVRSRPYLTCLAISKHFFPRHNQDLAPPSILIAMARTRAQTAAQTAAQRALPSPASNYQGIYSSQRQRTSPADACRKSTPGHPAV